MSKKPSTEKQPEAKAVDSRNRVVDALMVLAAEKPWDMITLSDIATGADMKLADLRDLFPSKGAILGAFVRRIDRAVLEANAADMVDEGARERVLDMMMRRFDALHPYRDALKSIRRGFERDPLGLLALNQQALNSWRYMLESVSIETDGPLGTLRIQGAIVVFARAFETFLDDADPALARTMAMLDKELARGEWVLRRAEGFDRLMAPLRGFCRAARETRRKRSTEAGEAA